MIVGFCGVLLFLFAPETFWDRAPIPRSRAPTRPGMFRRISSKWAHGTPKPPGGEWEKPVTSSEPTPAERPHKDVHFATGSQEKEPREAENRDRVAAEEHHVKFISVEKRDDDDTLGSSDSKPDQQQSEKVDEPSPVEPSPVTPAPASSSHHTQLPSALHLQQPRGGEVSPLTPGPPTAHETSQTATPSRTPSIRSLRFPWTAHETDEEKAAAEAKRNAYSAHWREREAKSFVQQLRPWHGRLNKDRWLKVAVRPFILYSYPSVLWSAAIYSCSVGWLIVVSESVTVIYRQNYYHFNALQTGLMYIAPFIGGVLGTAVAGKVSDIIVKAMARRNGGLYEPEFRLVMAIPIAITTVIGLMGYGWSAQERDNWIVPTVFLGVISFGCSLGSTTSITFCVDSYRQYAGEALVTLNFSKNIFHGLVFSFFVTGWIEGDGAKSVFIWIGVIQLIVLVFTIPMFIYGKRARMWTIRKNFMEKF